ncbi:MAG: hypothetical protein RL090_1107 [Bacteroidota bacterium]
MNSFFSLIICTYNRPESLQRLLVSVLNQTRRFDEVIVVDGSDELYQKKNQLYTDNGNQVKYIRVDAPNRGLTNQRNIGLTHINEVCTHVTFLDDDLVLDPLFCFFIESSFNSSVDAVGISGVDLVENRFIKFIPGQHYDNRRYFVFNNWVALEPFRYRLRSFFGLMSQLPPDRIPKFGHGRNGFPPDSGLHQVDHIMGGIATYKKDVFNHISFSEKFKGYGLYEDFDFSVRASGIGNLYVNTSAKVWHYHDAAGRPNMFRYGRMVVRNGWYVWRLKHPNPGTNNILKWHAITLLLAFLRLCNSFSVKKKQGAFGDFLGRMVGWFSLFIVSPSKRL